MTSTLTEMAAAKNSSEYAFTDTDFRMIAELANKKFGLFLQPSKKALVYSRLAKRLRSLDLPNFQAYCALLNQPGGEEEQSLLLSALTTNVTHFFRERHHFEYLRNTILPDLIARARSGASVRLWSSACSAGQEAYCIAAMVIDACSDAAKFDIRILATDIDPQIINKAKDGRYPREQLTAIPPEHHALMVDRALSDTPHVSMHAQLREIISFGQLNLIETWPMRRSFDVIFCRNVAIYFDKDTQSRLWNRFADALPPGGHLMIGHSERLCGAAEDRFLGVGVTMYKKVGEVGAITPSQRTD